LSELDIAVQKIPNVDEGAVIVVKGSIDAKTVIQFQRKLNSVTEDGIKRIVIDMEQVKYVNSTGLGYLINLADTVGADQGSVVFTNVQPKVKVVFDMLGLNAFFRMFNNRDQAIKAVCEGAAVTSGGGSSNAPTSASMPSPARTPLEQTAVMGPGVTAPAPPQPAPQVRINAPSPAPRAVPTAPVEARPAGPAMGDRVQIECQLCKASLIIEGPGTYKCPRCFAMFNYSGSDRVVFLPKRPIYPVQLTLNFAPECTEGLISFVKLFFKRSPSGLDGLQGELRSLVENIRRISYGGNENNIYHVQVLLKESELEMRFVDYGKPLSDQLFAETKKLVDRFELRAHPRGGNIISLMKRLS
jgi:anti-sigma B factor antagonist